MGHRNSIRCVRKGVAIVLSLAVYSTFPLARSSQSVLAQSQSNGRAAISPSQFHGQGPGLSAATAAMVQDGVLLRWQTDYELDNLGFNIYRVRNGQRARANRSLIPGSLFLIGEGKPLPGGSAYEWFDKDGTADSVYFI
jgi:hypothetical protein